MAVRQKKEALGTPVICWDYKASMGVPMQGFISILWVIRSLMHLLAHVCTFVRVMAVARAC